MSVHFQIPVYLYYTAGLSLASLLWLAPLVSPFAARASIVVALTLRHRRVFPRRPTGVSRHHGRSPRRQDSVGACIGAAAQQPQDRPREERRYASIIEIIRREVPPDGTIFAVPSNAELYFCPSGGTPSGSTTPRLACGATRIWRRRAILREHPPRLVTFNRDDKYNTPHSLQIMAMVRQRYVLLGRFEPFDVYVLP